MLRQICKGKLHRIRVTQADLNYMGSITLDSLFMEAANIRPFEMVQITNVENGVIWHTYAIAAKAATGTVCLNGPPARHFQPGDHIIVLSLAWIDDAEWGNFEASVVFVGDNNQILSVVKHKPQVWTPNHSEE